MLLEFNHKGETMFLGNTINGLLEGDSIFIKTITDIKSTKDDKEMKSIDELTEGPPRGGPPPRGGR